MDRLKQVLPIIGLFFYSLTLPANPLITLTSTNLSEVVDHIITLYGDQINMTESELTTYLLAWANDPSECPPLDVSILNEGPTSFTFGWPTPQGALPVKYVRVGALGLESGNSSNYTVTGNSVLVDAPLAELYLFTFMSDCILSESATNIIIVEKDIFFEGNLPDKPCYCPNSGRRTLSYDDLIMPVVSMEWNNKCPGYEQYRLDFEGHHSQYEDLQAFSLYFIHNDNNETPTINFWVCDKGYPEVIQNQHDVEQSIVDPQGNYEVMVTTSGVYIYFNNPNFLLTDYQGRSCGCGNVSDRQGDGFGANLSKAALQVSYFPNPVRSEGLLQLDLEEAGRLSVHLYNHLGQLVHIVDPGTYREAGAVQIPLDMKPLGTGVYTCQIVFNGQTHQHRMMKVD
ncbi:MAG: T9SS type A sorting domain-containing protein [Bacteroidota bacterium]